MVIIIFLKKNTYCKFSGSWSRPPLACGPRAPFVRERLYPDLDYDAMSDLEWEPEEREPEDAEVGGGGEGEIAKSTESETLCRHCFVSLYTVIYGRKFSLIILKDQFGKKKNWDGEG